MKLLVSYLWGRMLCTRWNLLQPDLEQTVIAKQASQKDNYDKHAQPRELCIGETVMDNNPKPGFPAVAAVIKKCLGPLAYLILANSGNVTLEVWIQIFHTQGTKSHRLMILPMILKCYQHYQLSLVLKKVAQFQLRLPLLLLDEGIHNANTDFRYGIVPCKSEIEH